MYKALYQKWRPKVFDEVVGQEYITTILKNEVNTGKIGHAYLFIGTRGTGKTSCARIFAKAVNCRCNNSLEKPCGKCDICTTSNIDSLQDIIELDAASNNGVNDMREICESTKFTPGICKYKVYIIDEVHMLSTGAFNALLKTLEEPPAHVIFILATTEVNKVPATILSRCQKFEFCKISEKKIAERLRFVAKKEEIFLEDEAAKLIAHYSDGALRDALSILDKCASLSEKITEGAVRELLLVTDKSLILKLGLNIINNDMQGALLILEKIMEQSFNAANVFSELLEFFNELMLKKTTGENTEYIEKNDKYNSEINDILNGINLDKILDTMDVLQEYLIKIPNSLDVPLLLQTFVINICSKKDSKSNCKIESTDNTILFRQLLAKVEKLENEIRFVKNSNFSAVNNRSVTGSSKNPPVYTSKDNELTEKRKVGKNEMDIFKNAKEMLNWGEVLEALKNTSQSLYVAFKDSSAYISGPYVLIDSPKKIAFELLKKSVQRDKIRSIIEEITGEHYRLGPYRKPSEVLVNAMSAAKSLSEKKDPLVIFADEARDLGIDVVVEDQ